MSGRRCFFCRPRPFAWVLLLASVVLGAGGCADPDEGPALDALDAPDALDVAPPLPARRPFSKALDVCAVASGEPAVPAVRIGFDDVPVDCDRSGPVRSSLFGGSLEVRSDGEPIADGFLIDHEMRWTRRGERCSVAVRLARSMSKEGVRSPRHVFERAKGQLCAVSLRGLGLDPLGSSTVTLVDAIVETVGEPGSLLPQDLGADERAIEVEELRSGAPGTAELTRPRARRSATCRFPAVVHDDVASAIVVTLSLPVADVAVLADPRSRAELVIHAFLDEIVDEGDEELDDDEAGQAAAGPDGSPP